MPASTSTRPAHLSSASDNWPTPQDFYNALDAEFGGFVLDVCASTANHKTTRFYALDHPDDDRRDGLAQDWAQEAAALAGPVWMNPPYGRPIAAWMSKAFEAAQAGATVVTLVPVRADTAWWHDLVLASGAEVRYVRGRLTFGDAVNTAAFSSAVVVYRPTDQVGAPGPVRTTPAHPTAKSRPEPANATEAAPGGDARNGHGSDWLAFAAPKPGGQDVENRPPHPLGGRLRGGFGPVRFPAPTAVSSPTDLHFRTGTVMVGDALERLAELPDNSVDSVVCDPPYGLSALTPAQTTAVIAAWVSGDTAAMPTGTGFMGKSWDAFVPPPALWAECLRVLKPGGHLAAFAGSRTVDLMGLSIRLAGLEVRDTLTWLYSSGMPKSHNVSIAIDKAAGATRAVIGHADPSDPRTAMARGIYGTELQDGPGLGVPVTAPTTAEAKQWDGWGTALKPAHEPIVLARKPLAGTVAANVLEHGTGGLNIDASRVAGAAGDGNWGGKTASRGYEGGWDGEDKPNVAANTQGRWPANLLLTHDAACQQLSAGSSSSSPAAEVSGGIWAPSTGKPAGPTYTNTAALWTCVPGCPVAVLDQQSGVRKSGLMLAGQQTRGYDGPSMGKFNPSVVANTTYGDTGGASRFFTRANWEPDLDGDPGFLYCAKPGKKERNAGLDHLPESGKVVNGQSAPASVSVAARNVQDKSTTAPRANTHPTVKPVAVMAWLIKLLTPPGGVVLDPFLGSGTTAVAAVREGFAFIGCEKEAEYLPILKGRIRHEKGPVRLRSVRTVTAVPRPRRQPSSETSRAVRARRSSAAKQT